MIRIDGKILTLGFLISFAVACGDDGTAGEPLNLCESSFAGDPYCFIPNFEEEVLEEKLEGCAVEGSCHARGTGQSEMVLDVAAPNTSIQAELTGLIGQSGLGGPLLDASCTDNSDVLIKLTASPRGGSQMPLGAPAWSEDEIQCFRKYLADTFQ